MRIEIDARGDVCILRLKGRFVTGSKLDYERTRDTLQRRAVRKVVADFSEVPYIDSTGLGFLVELYAIQKEAGGCFVLANLNQRVRAVFSLTQLDREIPCFEDEDAALAALVGSEAAGSKRVSSA